MVLRDFRVVNINERLWSEILQRRGVMPLLYIRECDETFSVRPAPTPPWPRFTADRRLYPGSPPPWPPARRSETSAGRDSVTSSETATAVLRRYDARAYVCTTGDIMTRRRKRCTRPRGDLKVQVEDPEVIQGTGARGRLEFIQH